MNEKIAKTLTALKRNNMEAFYCEKKEDIVPLVENMLFEGCTLSSGGSVSLKESGVYGLITEKRYNYLDRSKPGISPEEQANIFKEIIGADFYFCSANAITENGELINVDGFCNRITALTFGPKKVIVIVGINKLVKNVEEGFLRVKRVAAPKNCVRLNLDTPCAKLGHCVSLLKSESPSITDGCNSENRICCSYTVNAKQRTKDRITVILCNETLGY